MKLVPLPSYKILFGEPTITYEEILSEVPSEIVLMLLFSLNAELNTPQPYNEKIKRLWQVVSFRFTKEQHAKFAAAFAKYYRMTGSYYDGTLFARPYLLEMMLKEFKRNRIVEPYVDDPIHEYNFLLAYLLLIDEANKGGQDLLDNAKQNEEKIFPAFPLLWAGGIRQHEFNQNANIVYEIFRLMCFLRYSYKEFNSYLKELINKFSFQTISQFVGSFHQIVNVTLMDNPDEPLRKLIFITPNSQINQDHLKSQCCNILFETKQISISDLRKFPLYKTKKRGYMIVDEDLYRKKIYKGPLFEMQKVTRLNEVLGFEDYKTEISKNCFEKIFFRSISKLMIKTKYDTLHFDDSGDRKPDLFYRNNKKVLLVEFKDYLFPDSVMAGKDYAAFKKYIDERFVKSDKEKAKGIKQLVSNITELYKMNYDFDATLNEMITKNQQGIKIYPVICHTDFMFGMVGINEYLNIQFQEEIKQLRLESAIIKNVTVISLEVLFDFSLRGNDFIGLLELIDRYWGIIKSRRIKCQKGGSISDFLSSNISFDELYETRFKPELIEKNILTKKVKTNQLIENAGLQQEQLDEVL